MFNYIVTLTPGAMFGEKGLDENQPRNATVICSKDCDFGVMYKEDYIHVLKELSKAKGEKRKEFVLTKVFNNMIPPSTADKLGYDFFRLKEKVSKGRVIFSQGDESDYIYVVKSGKVVLYRDQPIKSLRFQHDLLSPSIQSKRFNVAEIGEGEIFGDTWILGKGTQRFFGAAATDNCEILRVSLTTMNYHFGNEPLIREIIFKYCKLRMKKRLKILRFQLLQKKHEIRDFNLQQLGLKTIENENDESEDENFLSGIHIGSKKINLHARLAIVPPNPVQKRMNIANSHLKIGSRPNTKLISSKTSNQEEKQGIASISSRCTKIDQSVTESRIAKTFHLNFSIDSNVYDIDKKFLEICRASRKCRTDEKKSQLASIKYMHTKKKRVNSSMKQPGHFVGDRESGLNAFVSTSSVVNKPRLSSMRY